VLALSTRERSRFDDVFTQAKGLLQIRREDLCTAPIAVGDHLEDPH
jgi:hypothetical protein